MARKKGYFIPLLPYIKGSLLANFLHFLTKPSLYACNFEERFHQTKKFAKLAVMAFLLFVF